MATKLITHPHRKLSCGTFWSNPKDLDFTKIKNECAMLCSLHNGVAIAAPQVGKLERWFYHAGLHQVFVNPAIVDSSETTEVELEGCLSLPNQWLPIERRTFVRVHWEDEDSNWNTGEFHGLEARIVQHEIDHLNGICIIDK